MVGFLNRKRFPVKSMIVVAVLCLVGAGSFAFAGDMGKGEVKAETVKMAGDVKTEAKAEAAKTPVADVKAEAGKAKAEGAAPKSGK